MMDNQIKIQDKRTKIFLNLNLALCFVLAVILILFWFKIFLAKNELILAAISIAASATAAVNAIKSLKNKKISIDLLASIALIVSLLGKEWISAIFINLMIASARAFTEYVKIRSHSAINSLMKLKPKKVNVIKDGKMVEISLEHVKKGDKVVVDLGEGIPVDGFIERGEASVDQSSLTGESAPVFKKMGDKVLSFTTVVSGNLVVKAEKVGRETTFEKIVSLVERSQMNKAPIGSLIDKFANWYIVLTILGSLAVYLISRDLTLVAALLLVSCADDIAIATPLALMSAITHGAKHGAIIKGGDYLEGLAKLKMIIFDKTGTLTKGKLKVEKIAFFGGKTQEEVLQFAAIASSCSTHPVAQAIVKYAKEKNILLAEPENCQEIGGKGISAFYNNKKIIIGKLSFFNELKIDVEKERLVEAEKEISSGFNVTLVAYDGELVGFVALLDEIRPGAQNIMKEFKRLGVLKTVMLTGDNEKVAQKIAAETGIDEFHANLLPQEKLEYLKKSLNKKYKVAMVGDGVNDAPVLAMSDIGIAMGAIGTDAAIEAADIALMRDDLSQIPELIKIGHSTMRVVRQNLIMWGALNVLGFSLVFLHVLNPSGAAAYNFISDFIPIFNSLRLFR